LPNCVKLKPRRHYILRQSQSPPQPCLRTCSTTETIQHYNLLLGNPHLFCLGVALPCRSLFFRFCFGLLAFRFDFHYRCPSQIVERDHNEKCCFSLRPHCLIMNGSACNKRPTNVSISSYFRRFLFHEIIGQAVRMRRLSADRSCAFVSDWWPRVRLSFGFVWANLVLLFQICGLLFDN
jgi:hypothetical protein